MNLPGDKRYKFAILKNESKDDHLDWVKACENYLNIVDYEIIDLIAADWLEKVTDKYFDFFLARPPGRVAYFKQLYDERIYIINQILNLPVYPSINEILIYENKRFLSYFLKSKNIPYPETKIFYHQEEAVNYLNYCRYPFVAKTNIGAGGSGVKIIKSKNEANDYIEKSFSQIGIRRSYGPNLRKGNYWLRLKNRAIHISDAVEYFKEKKIAATIDPQKWFVLFQEYIKSDYEWRCVVINNSYFGHKKLRTIGDKISGTSKVSWDYPDKELLNFVRKIVVENNFWSQAIDIFFNPERGYLVNELQCFWGSKNPHQMIKNSNPGRYIFHDGNWIFEKGSFNQNNSFDLRLKHVLEILEN